MTVRLSYLKTFHLKKVPIYHTNAINCVKYQVFYIYMYEYEFQVANICLLVM